MKQAALEDHINAVFMPGLNDKDASAMLEDHVLSSMDSYGGRLRDSAHHFARSRGSYLAVRNSA